MINTSMAYKEAIESNREFGVSDKITFADGTTVTLAMGDYLAYSINEATSASGKFEIGAAVIKEYSATLKNDDGRFDAYDFEGADILSRISLKLADGTWETLRKGTYRITSAKATEMTIQIKAYDSMLFFDKPYSTSRLSYPATVNQIIQEACTSCQMTFDASTVEMGSYKVQTRPKADSLTYRDVVSYCAQIMGCYARIDHLDKLSFGWYKLDDFEQYSDGGVFDDDTPYRSGDSVEGGSFDNYSSGDNLDGGSFDNLAKYYHFYNLSSQTINTDDIRITGIQVSAKGESSEDIESALYGTEGYVLEIADNPLTQVGAVDVVAQHVGAKLVGNTFRPLSITCQSDPSIEAGDIALVTDRRQRTYQTVITNTTFALGGLQKVECTAETPTEKNYTKYGAVTKLITKVNDETDQKLSAYELASAHFGQLMAHSMGLYETEDVDPNTGAKIRYMHDKPKLEDSTTIWKQTIDAFAWSTDGGKTWNGGVEAAGNVMVTVLDAVGVDAGWVTTGFMKADRIQGGTLRLGGENNSNGELYVFDANKKLIGTLNKDGMSLTQGVVENVNEDLGIKTQLVQGAVKFFSGNNYVGAICSAKNRNSSGKGGIMLTVPSGSVSSIWFGYSDQSGETTGTYQMKTSESASGYTHNFEKGIKTDKLFTNKAECTNGNYVKSTVNSGGNKYQTVERMYIALDSIMETSDGTLYLHASDGRVYSARVKYYIEEEPIG